MREKNIIILGVMLGLALLLILWLSIIRIDTMVPVSVAPEPIVRSQQVLPVAASQPVSQPVVTVLRDEPVLGVDGDAFLDDDEADIIELLGDEQLVSDMEQIETMTRELEAAFSASKAPPQEQE